MRLYLACAICQLGCLPFCATLPSPLAELQREGTFVSRKSTSQHDVTAQDVPIITEDQGHRFTSFESFQRDLKHCRFQKKDIKGPRWTTQHLFSMEAASNAPDGGFKFFCRINLRKKEDCKVMRWLRLSTPTMPNWESPKEKAFQKLVNVP